MSPLLSKYNFHVEALLCAILTLSLIGIPATVLTSRASANLRTPLPANRVSQHDRSDAYGALPLSFELNQGQTDERVKFLARSEGYVLFLTATEAIMALDNPAAHKRGKENRDERGRFRYERSYTQVRHSWRRR